MVQFYSGGGSVRITKMVDLDQIPGSSLLRDPSLIGDELDKSNWILIPGTNHLNCKKGLFRKDAGQVVPGANPDPNIIHVQIIQGQVRLLVGNVESLEWVESKSWGNRRWRTWRSSGKKSLVIKYKWGKRTDDTTELCFFPKKVIFSGHIMTVMDIKGGTAKLKRFDGTRDNIYLNLECDISNAFF